MMLPHHRDNQKRLIPVRIREVLVHLAKDDESRCAGGGGLPDLEGVAGSHRHPTPDAMALAGGKHR
jgi:hypothetical protein